MEQGQQDGVVGKGNPEAFKPRGELEQQRRRSLRQNDADRSAERQQQIKQPEGRRAAHGQSVTIIQIADEAQNKVDSADEKQDTHIISKAPLYKFLAYIIHAGVHFKSSGEGIIPESRPRPLR